MLDLPNIFVSEEAIAEAYEKKKEAKKESEGDEEALKKFKLVAKAYNCLKKAQCRNEYTRFGQTVSISQDIEGMIDFDWRIVFSPIFYILLAFVHGTLGSVEQKPGLRLAMGLGIISCMTEVQLLTAVAQQIDNGFAMEEKLKQYMDFFPAIWCTFEIIQV